jgi:hypothetical protein
MDKNLEFFARVGIMTCARCTHALADHCKGSVSHSDMKDQRPGWPARQTVCATRHCLHPLCSCVDFVERAA